ncbi:MAG: helix-turn-helix transcriptional regulator [Veillonella sp.]|uniref:helix-turn-helix domain-containing protein n=1 Tax=Veillonella sp. TaxID=1926307 RepID=UPI00257959CD|nr:helix-turn-helix transcriptional regulator [Veillonella sp.]MBS6483246.1 helix-turn-helix transcriptional regulator [Veillonella sp.]
MIVSNLKNILKDKNISATTLSKLSDVSRTAINQLVNNASGGIQFDTIDKICFTLGVKIDDLLLYSPFDIDINVKDVSVNGDEISVDAILVLKEPFEVPNDKDTYTYNTSVNKDIPLTLKQYNVYDATNLVVEIRDKNDLLYYQTLISDLSYKMAMYIRSKISDDIEQVMRSKLERNITVLPSLDFAPILDNKNINARDIHRLLSLVDR